MLKLTNLASPSRQNIFAKASFEVRTWLLLNFWVSKLTLFSLQTKTGLRVIAADWKLIFVGMMQIVTFFSSGARFSQPVHADNRLTLLFLYLVRNTLIDCMQFV